MEETIPTAEVAQRLKLTPAAISLMVKRGDIKPVYKMPGLRGGFLFSPSSVEEIQKGNS